MLMPNMDSFDFKLLGHSLGSYRSIKLFLKLKFINSSNFNIVILLSNFGLKYILHIQRHVNNIFVKLCFIRSHCSFC